MPLRYSWFYSLLVGPTVPAVGRRAGPLFISLATERQSLCKFQESVPDTLELVATHLRATGNKSINDGMVDSALLHQIEDADILLINGLLRAQHFQVLARARITHDLGHRAGDLWGYAPSEGRGKMLK